MANQYTKRREALANNPMAAAVPDSRNFGAPDAPEFPPRLAGKHVGGVPCEQLPESVWHLMSVDHTDEGIAARNEGKAAPGSGARITRSEFDGQKERLRDFREAAPVEDFDLAPDPMRELRDRYVPPGMAACFLSGTNLGKVHGATGGWDIVKDEQGEPVRLGTLVLAQMPQHVRDAKQERYRAEGARNLQNVYLNASDATGGRIKPVSDASSRREQPLPAASEDYFPDFTR